MDLAIKRNNNDVTGVQDLEDIVVSICQKYDDDHTRLMDILLDIQERLRGIDPEAMELVARQVGCHRVDVEGVVSFYSFFSEEKKGEITIRLCDDIIDRYAGVAEIAGIFSEELGVKPGQTSEDGRFSLEYTPCIGMCDQAPAALINETVITRLTPGSAREIARQLKQNTDIEALDLPAGDGNNQHELIKAPVLNNIRKAGEVLLCDVPQEAGLEKALQMSAHQVVGEIVQSGLAGRGGAGFPTGKKWELAAATDAERRYIFCNADEGEPGTFKDRVLLTERADLLIEGMTIAAYAIGSSDGLIYLRGEYIYLRPYLEHVLQCRREQGLLGQDIAGKAGFSFDIRIQLGAGAYICGEESALISSCEGKRGEPKNRPPFPVESGYLGFPTVVNNVETFCCAARILDRGASWYSNIGTEKSKGTKLLSVSGDCERPGVYELPFGVTVRELLEMAGAPGSAAVQAGGPSGEMINQSQFDRKICSEDLSTGGAIMVFSSNRNILEIVDYFMSFFVDECCGYCTPCRVGNVFLKMRIEKTRKGFAETADLQYLKDLAELITRTSRCGLGQTSSKPVVSTIENFPLVYAALLKENKDGMQAAFDIQSALEESRWLAKRRSMIYDLTYDQRD